MEDCEHCKTWEEEMYWKHFNTFHFTQVLPPDFHDHLVLPEKFSHHMKTQLPDKVSLKGPSGALWEVQLLKTGDLLFAGSEWKDFVKAHDLKQNCCLMFKFKRNSIFEVLIFDQVGFCEKESAYFVKKCKHLNSDFEEQRKRTKGDGSTEIIEDKSEEDSTFVVSKKSKKNEIVQISLERKEKTQTTKRMSYVDAKRNGRTRRVQVKLPRKQAGQSGKGSIRNEMEEEQSHMSQRDVINPENGESLPKNVQSQKLESLSKKNLNIAKEITGQVIGELIASDNEEYSEAVDHYNILKSQSEKQPIGDDTAKDTSQISERGLNGEESEPRGRGTGRESTKNSGLEVIRPDYRESSPEEEYSPISLGKRGRPKKQALPTSSKKLVFRSASNGKTVPKEYKSNRRAVTEKEKGEAFQRATKKETEKSFTAIMQPTSVYKRFFMSVPLKWLLVHLPNRNQQVVLRVGEKTWPTTLSYHAKRGGGISTGWKKFALDNNLEESDLLVFKLVSQKDETPVVMDVDIFRVVPTINPLSPLTS